MRVLVCGGRDFKDSKTVYEVLDALHSATPISCIIHGGARGADSLAALWAQHREVRAKHYPADWETHGKAAGPIRNRQMLVEGQPDLIVAFPGGRGTADMVRQGRRFGVRVESPVGDLV